MQPNDQEITQQYNEVKKKAFFLVFVSFLSAIVYWKVILLNLVGNEIQNGVGWPAIICPFLLVLLYNTKEKFVDYAFIVGLVMAICLGIFLGTISGSFEKGFEGVIIKAVLTTFSSVFAIIFLYKNKFITVNNKFLHFTSFVASTLSLIAMIDVIMSFIVLDWHSFFSGVTTTAIALNAIIILLAYLVFTIDLNVIDEKIKSRVITNNEIWSFGTELLIDVGWIYFAIIFLIMRLRGRKNS